jgi:hypothetical protein
MASFNIDDEDSLASCRDEGMNTSGSRRVVEGLRVKDWVRELSGLRALETYHPVNASLGTSGKRTGGFATHPLLRAEQKDLPVDL